MARVETLKEWFFPVSAHTVNGETPPPPAEAVRIRDKLRSGWYRNQPYIRKEEKPRVSMGPAVRDGQPGYSVRKEIVYMTESEQIPSPVNLPLPEGLKEGVSSN